MKTGYIRETWEFDNCIEVQEKHTGRYGARGMKRQKKEKVTPEDIARQNQWKKERTVWRLIKWNFPEGSYWTTLTYAKGKRPDADTLKRDIAKFIRKLREGYRKEGWELKYIYRLQIGKKGAPHVHILLNDCRNENTGTDKLILKAWKHGHTYIKLTYEDGDYKELAKYIAIPREEWEPESIGSYVPSRNLIRKESTKKPILRRVLREGVLPKAPKGYYVDPDSVRFGVNPVTGFLYRHYMLIKEKRRN